MRRLINVTIRELIKRLEIYDQDEEVYLAVENSKQEISVYRSTDVRLDNGGDEARLPLLIIVSQN
jgi:hypothetical protein